MEYIYDINLNFLKKYYDFFEWTNNDSIKNIKKIPVFRVNTLFLNTIKNNKIKIINSFLDKIHNKTILFDNKKIAYACLFTDTNQTVAIIFNRNGNNIFKSSLVYDEEDEVNDLMINAKKIIIKYKNIKKYKQDFITRSEESHKNYLYNYLNKLNDNQLLKYIYFDYFKKESEDYLTMKNELYHEIINNKNIEKLYNKVIDFEKIVN